MTSWFLQFHLFLFSNSVWTGSIIHPSLWYLRIFNTFYTPTIKHRYIQINILLILNWIMYTLFRTLFMCVCVCVCVCVPFKFGFFHSSKILYTFVHFLLPLYTLFRFLWSQISYSEPKQRESSSGVMPKVKDLGFKISKSEIHWTNYIHFRTNTLGIGKNTPYPPSYKFHSTPALLLQGWFWH